jgi:cytochrome P450
MPLDIVRIYFACGSHLYGTYSTLLFGGMDNTSSTLSRILFLLATHPETQARLREEILQARPKNGEFSYDELGSLPFLDAVCRETLRL